MQVDLLINLVRERSAIYDPSHPVHRDRDAIASIWKEIASEMNIQLNINFFTLFGQNISCCFKNKFTNL